MPVGKFRDGSVNRPIQVKEGIVVEPRDQANGFCGVAGFNCEPCCPVRRVTPDCGGDCYTSDHNDCRNTSEAHLCPFLHSSSAQRRGSRAAKGGSTDRVRFLVLVLHHRDRRTAQRRAFGSTVRPLVGGRTTDPLRAGDDLMHNRPRLRGEGLPSARLH